MHIQREFDQGAALPVGWRVRVLVLAAHQDDPLVLRMGALGGPIEVETELYAGLSAIIDDPAGYGLLVMDCDAFGGAETGRRALRALGADVPRLPAMLISREHDRHQFPQDRGMPVLLRGPVSPVSLRVGFEHALRDRLAWLAA